jgi:hypothetical protein
MKCIHSFTIGSTALSWALAAFSAWEIRTHDPNVGEGKDSPFLRQRCHCDWLFYEFDSNNNNDDDGDDDG